MTIVITTEIISTASALLGVVLGSLGTYLVTRKLEKDKFLLDKQKQAAKIAKLLAYWSKYGTIDRSASDFLEGEDLATYYSKLNQMTWELVVWLPEDKMVRDLMGLFSYSNPNISTKQMVAQARSILNHNSSISSEEIVHFPKKETGKLRNR